MSSSYLQVFRSPRLAVILALGFSSGLPLALTGGTLQAWMTVEGVDLSTIGIFTLVGLPYVWKFLWAPAMDRFVPPFLGRRRGWLVLTQLALAAGIAAMAFLSPRSDLAAIAWLALFVAFASASQDIVVDAYRTDVASREERGLAGALGVVGYRLAMLVSGALALVLVAGSGWIPALGWRNTYLLMAVLMAIGVLAAFWGEEPSTAPAVPKSLREAVVEPLREFFSRPKAVWILVLLVLYKLGDAFAGSLTTAFLLRGAGFSLEDVGYVNKAVGLASTIVGVLFGGALMVRLGLYRALLGFGVLQAASILTFMWLALAGKSYPIMVFAVGFENIAWGMGTAAFVALLMALCDHRFTATQYALLSALASFGRVYVGPVAGYATDPKYMGLSWPTFFFAAFIVALPGLVFVWLLRKEIDRAEAAATPRGIVKVLAISGSLRAASINSALLRAAVRLSPPEVKVRLFRSAGELPLFNPDLEAQLPPRVAALHGEIASADALLIASPEYAHGVTGTIKNVLDWLVSFEPFINKSVAVFNASPRAHHADDALRETLRTMSAVIVEEASVSIPLLGAGLTEDAMVEDPVISRAVRSALQALRRAVVLRNSEQGPTFPLQ